MFCTNCGSQVDDGLQFCPNCGNKLEPLNEEPVVKAAAAQQTYQQPAGPVYQQPTQPAYQQPVQGAYQQPAYQQPVYQQPVYQQPVYQQPAPQPAPVKRRNGAGVTGLVFGIITLVLLIISFLLFRGAISSYYYSGSEVSMAIGLVCFFLACILYIFNFIFGIIGFIRGLKTKAALAAGIIGFVLIFINAILIIWEAAAFVGIMIALM